MNAVAIRSLFRSLPVAGTIAVLVLLPILVGLGMWQQQRAEYRESVRDQREARMADAPVGLGAERVDAEAVRWRRAQVRGRYEEPYTVLLDNRVHGGRPGVHVYTAMAVDGGGPRLLVNRGWVPWGASRADRPEVSTPEGVVTLSGLLDLPPEPGLVLGREEPDGGWPLLRQTLDLEATATRAGFAVQPVVLVLDPEQPGGFVRDFDPGYNDGWIARHRAYAFQWFALAFTLFALYAWTVWRRRHRVTPGPRST